MSCRGIDHWSLFQGTSSRKHETMVNKLNCWTLGIISTFNYHFALKKNMEIDDKEHLYQNANQSRVNFLYEI